jgi:16S rRNA (guanine1516-N2)-methyltransferase
VPELQAICQRIQLHPQAFETPIDPPVDAVYLDPMFPSKAKSALPSKAMQWMSIMTENCLTDEKLLEIAMDSATEKVILKRPLHAPILAPDQLRGQKKGKSHRFDIYMGRASRAQSTHVIM